MEEIDEKEYNEILVAMLLKKSRYLKENDLFKKKAKLARFAIGRGFEPQLVWEKIKDDPDEKTRFLTDVGAEAGRFHAMGFVHGDFSLPNICVRRETEKYAVSFAISGRTRWYSKAGVKSLAEDMEPLKREFLSRISDTDAAVFMGEYRKAFDRR